MTTPIDPLGPRRPNETRSAYMRRVFDRKPSRADNPEQDPGFWLSVLLDYVKNNPGCSKSEAAKSITPMRSIAMGHQLINLAISDQRLRVVSPAIGKAHQLFIENDR